ncbi:MAG TPA: hypothetical protein VLE69_00105 [Candidatus Saccharimonadales bacterium]|nr:hypothetical protein [Candidatus Saccharimonadales bacterium]
MKKIQIRIKLILVAFLFLLTTVISGVGLAYANAGNPPGNNGTIKMDGSDLDSNAKDNDPHLACNLTVQWFGFDVGSRTSTVEFVTQPPTPTGSENLLLTKDSTFTGQGSGNIMDYSETYNLSSQLSGYTPQAQQGYHIKVTVATDGSQGNDTKSKVFWIEPCVTAVSPDFTIPSCQVQSKTVTPPNITGVVWDPSGPTVLNSGNPTVTYNAAPAPGYAFPDGTKTSWTFNYVAPLNCGEVIGENVENIEVVGDPSFTDATCKTDGSYTVVAQEGVIYKDGDGNVINPGTYQAPNGTTIKIYAYPDQGFIFDENAQTLWTHTFNAPSCGQVLGESTETGGTTSTGGDPQVLAASTTLTNTGVSPAPLTLLASLLIMLGVGIYSIHPRKTVKKQIEVHFL